MSAKRMKMCPTKEANNYTSGGPLTSTTLFFRADLTKCLVDAQQRNQVIIENHTFEISEQFYETDIFSRSCT